MILSTDTILLSLNVIICMRYEQLNKKVLVVSLKRNIDNTNKQKYYIPNCKYWNKYDESNVRFKIAIYISQKILKSLKQASLIIIINT